MKRIQSLVASLLAVTLTLLWVAGSEASERRSRRTVTVNSCTSGTCSTACENGKCVAPAAAKASVAPAPDNKPAPTAPAVTVQQRTTTVTKTKTWTNRRERRSGCSCIGCGG